MAATTPLTSRTLNTSWFMSSSWKRCSRARQLASGDFTGHTEPTDRVTQYTPDFLARVASAHAKGSYAAVQEEFDVSRRQASRYISRARDAGLIER